MKRLTIGTLAVAGAALLAASASASEGKGGRWDKLDVNGDGQLTADEMDERTAKFLDGADADGDGAISKEEMKTFHEARRAEHRAKRNPDKNGDGVADRNEFVNSAQSMFDRLDKDGNGLLSEDELQREGGRRFKGGDRGDADANGDGVIDRTEWIASAQSRFEKMDKDGNGVLSEDEMSRKGERRFRRGAQE